SSPHRSAKPAQHTTHKRTAKQPAPHTPPANNHGAETKNLTRRCRTSVPDEPPLIVLRNLRSIPPGSARRSRAEQSPARPPRCSSLRVPGPRSLYLFGPGHNCSSRSWPCVASCRFPVSGSLSTRFPLNT
ncbi:hypothetical protein JMJ77_0000572, partial [Colletotrichum scovillei]